MRPPRLNDPLSASEAEVLSWASLGKTAEEIGIILSVTRRRVQHRFTTCSVKLGTVNKTHSVARAIRNGLI